MEARVLSGITPENLSVTDFSSDPDPQIPLTGDTGLVGESTGPSAANGPPDAVSGPLAESGPVGDNNGPSADSGPPGAPKPATCEGNPADNASLATDGATAVCAPPGSRLATGDCTAGAGGAGASPSSASATPAAARDTRPEATVITAALHHMGSQSRCPSADVLAEPSGETLPSIHRRGGVVARPAVVEEGVIGPGFDDDLVHQPGLL